jgi:protein TonB
MLKVIFSYFNKSSTFVSGLLAVAIYLFLLLLLAFYFEAEKKSKPIHYVKKNEDKIRVSIMSEQAFKAQERPNIIVPSVSKRETAKRQKDKSKKFLKEKVIKKPKKPKKPKEEIKEKPKKVNSPKDLFTNVKTVKKPKETKPKKEKPKPKAIRPKTTRTIKKKSASEILSESLKVQEKRSDRGVENAYFSSVESKLKQGWGSQSGFLNGVGRALVLIKISPNGHFRFTILTYSSNQNFNHLLRAYLAQYQKIGLGRHQGNRVYEIEIEFEANE